MRVAIDQRLNLEAIRRISDAKLIQLVDEAARKGGLKATPKDDDTFLNDEKGCLFLLNANFPLQTLADMYDITIAALRLLC